MRIGQAASSPRVSVVIAAYTPQRWDDLRRAVASVRAQTVPVLETIVVIDHHPELLEHARRGLAGVTVIPNLRDRGASGARNAGVAASHGEVIAFLDDDAVAAPDWLHTLLRHFTDPDVIGVGGRLDPLWDTSRPSWFPPEFDWTVGASYRGMPEHAERVRNVWSTNMAIRRPVFDAVGGFRDDFGKVGQRSRPEDTDLCLRAAGSPGGGAWIYDPAGAAGHRVPAQRATLGYFLHRCFNEGWGKAALCSLDGAGESMSAERGYAWRVLPGAVLRGLRDTARGDLGGAARSFVITVGLTYAAAGFLIGWSAGLLNPPRSLRPGRPGCEPEVARAEDAASPAAAITRQFAPVQMMDVELSDPLPTVRAGGTDDRAWVLARLHTEPVGACFVDVSGGLTPLQLGALLWPDLREPLSVRFIAAGLAAPSALTGEGVVTGPAAWPFLASRRQVLAGAPFISVVVCTRDRASRLPDCLRWLAQQDYPGFEVVIVDNAPTGDAVRTLVQDWQGDLAVRYAVELRGGLSRARNAGIAAAAGDIIAFLDDDEEPDRHWLAELARGFALGDEIGCVTGLILPARLDTSEQEWFELAGGHSKDRGFQPAVFSRRGPQNPLFPLPPFGAGGNMAFRREALAAIGGFDVALGAGTPARSGEDTLALTLTLLAGYHIAYQPAAFVRHDHYADSQGLRRQLNGYSTGLTAYYTALLRHRPGTLPALLRLTPAAVGYLRGRKVPSGPVQGGLPGVERRRLRMLAGPGAYLRSMRQAARAGNGTRR